MKDMETDNDEDFYCFNCFCSEYPMLEGHIAQNGEVYSILDKNIDKKF